MTGVESTRDPEQTRKTFRLVAIAAGVWFLGSGIWGLVTETPADRAGVGCEASARKKIDDSGAGVQRAEAQQGQSGWTVTGTVQQEVDGEVLTTYQWTCLTNDDGRSPEITVWTPAG